MEYTRDELLKIGYNLASIWGGECYDVTVENGEYIFHCVEHGEFFITSLKEEELEQFKHEAY